MNIRLLIAYDGSRYAGWQTQTGRLRSADLTGPRTVQEALEKALRTILRQKVVLIGSSRTDAGVHALAMVAHFHTEQPVNFFRLKGALNGLLPRDIAVTDAREVSLDFHARFDAVSKRYEYVLLQKKGKQVFSYPGAVAVPYALDTALMNREARCLIGKHDFRSFQGSDRVARRSLTTIRKIFVKKIKKSRWPFLRGVNVILIEIEATGFLRGMVRNIVGTLMDIGRGKIKKGELKKILEAKDRRRAGVCAPAAGLTLTKVRYG